MNAFILGYTVGVLTCAAIVLVYAFFLERPRRPPRVVSIPSSTHIVLDSCPQDIKVGDFITFHDLRRRR